jgi:hypothetical protein
VVLEFLHQLGANARRVASEKSYGELGHVGLWVLDVIFNDRLSILNLVEFTTWVITRKF